MDSLSPELLDRVVAERLSGEALQAQINHFKEMKNALILLNSIPDSAIVLNSYRQVIFANKAFCDFVKLEDSEILGMRLGEIVKCEHSGLEPGGCGMSAYCSVCGALNSMMRTIVFDGKCMDECRLTTQDLDAFEFEVSTSPYETEIGSFVFTHLKDISEQKRKQILERTFLHDLLNSVGGMRGLVELLAAGDGQEEFSGMVLDLTDEIIDEIRTHQMLYSAEKGETELELRALQSTDILKKLEPFFKNREVALNKKLKIVNIGEPFEIQSDEILLNRVLINLIKNAFEASQQGMVVVATVRKEGDEALFTVHNNTFIERNVQLQVFKRSFSTKGTGRGIGTYSMRLITEKYLKGSISFESHPESGTTFTVRLPLNPQSNLKRGLTQAEQF